MHELTHRVSTRHFYFFCTISLEEFKHSSIGIKRRDMAYFKPHPLLLLARAIVPIFLINLLASTTLKAQNSKYRLSLFTKDKATGQLLSATTIAIGSEYFISGDSGQVIIQRNSLGSFHAVFSHVGYDKLDVHFFPKSLFETDTVFLTPGGGNLQEVTVKGYIVTNGVNAIAPATVLSQSDLDKMRGETLGKMLQVVAGVNMLQTGNTIAKPIVDGQYGNRVLVINNGVRLEGQQWGIEHAPEVDPSIAHDITVVKGADAVRYGAEALGGVILLDPAPLPFADPTLHGEVNLNGVTNGRGGGGSATLNSSFRKLPGLAWRVQGSYSRLGNYETKYYYLENTGTEQKNFSGTLGYQGKNFGGQVFFSQYQTSLGIFIGSDIGSVADLLARIHSTGPYERGSFSYDYSAPYQSVKHQLLKGRLYYNTKDSSHFEVSYNLQIDHRQEYDMRRATRSTIPINDWILHTNTLEGKWEKTIMQRWHTTAGINLRGQSNYNDTNTLSNPFIPNYSSNTIGLYGIERLVLNDKFDLEAGGRYDYQQFNAAGQRYLYLYYDSLGNVIPNEQVPDYPGRLTLHGGYHQYGGDRTFASFSFITGALWKINPGWNLRSNLGLAWRAPNPEELYSYGLDQGSGAIEYGDSTLKSEHGYKWITTVTKAGNHLSFYANMYLQFIQNYIYRNPTDSFSQTITGSYPVFRFLQTNAFFKGLDLDGKYNFGNDGRLFQYELKASFVRAYDIAKDAYLPAIPADRYTNSLQYNIPASRKLQNNFFQVSYLYVTRQTRYEPNSDFLPPPASYGLWGLNAGTKILLGDGSKSITVDLTVDNLFNVAYRDYLNRFRYYADDIGRNIQLHCIFRF
ncbi:MAG TPA: TonB-dependent receptor [Puia sp.]|nr:TonB-dependent receptor [Puia sp.]